MTTYRGQRIIRCNWEEGRHRGKWYIQTYHYPTGMAWSDEECPHFDTIAQAKAYVKEGKAIWTYNDTSIWDISKNYRKEE